MNIHDIVAAQREAIRKEKHEKAVAPAPSHGWKREAAQRIDKLRRLRELLRQSESAVLAALSEDLGKSPGEAYLTELGMVLAELSHTIRGLRSWMKPRRVRGSLSVFPSRCLRLPEPYGLVLILSPWNYPFQLTMVPLIGAIAAGNRCVVKPSNQSPRTAQLIADLVAAWLPAEEAAVVLGGREENAQLLDQRFDHIFFTGGQAVGRLVMRKAAEHLTPVTLELGGKSPCIVDASADIDLAARRIAFGKGINAGQTCVAPDYLLVQRDVKAQLLAGIEASWRAFYGDDPLISADWPRIINAKHHGRLMDLLRAAQATEQGGEGRIAPTLIDGAYWDSPLMREEIFGPLLPVITFDSQEEVIDRLSQMEKPLALYLFSRDEDGIARVMRGVSFGGGCVNDTLIHLSNPRLPFGGVGASGMGSYHGRQSFDTFSHIKSLVRKGRLDFSFRYPPYGEGKLRLLRRILR